MQTMEVEIALRKEEPGDYGVQLRVVRSDSEMLIQPAEGRTGFDVEALSGLDPLEYGRRLTASLFAPDEVGQRFGEARAVAETDELTLRLRLLIHANAPELHALRWETLVDPRTGEWLLTSEKVLFSRLVAGADWQRVSLRPYSALQALVVAANPSDLKSTWNLEPIDPETELKRARAGLGEIPVSTLEKDARVTLPNLADALRQKDYDILYLACHGALRKGDPSLLLENQAGEGERVGGTQLVEQIRNLEVRPRLIVLASCESAGTGEGMAGAQALAALGPRLAEAGVPAVLAMQGNVSMDTVGRLLPAFFRALEDDGRVDYALAVARNQVLESHDRWMPALFLRLKNGRIWYVPGFAGEGTLQRWSSLLNNVSHNRCTPILGSGLLETLVGTSKEMAARLAGEGFPLEPHEKEDLPQVAQYLATMQQDQFVRDQWLEIQQRELSRRFGDELAAGAALPEDHVDRLSTSFSRAGALLRQRDPVEPHKVLASLPFPLYITTNPDSLLVDALVEADKEPQVELCRWRQDLPWPPSLYDDRDEPGDYVPAEKRPLVYYLFGRLQEPQSIVLTEDNYFDYLIGVSRPAQDSPHPEPVLRAQGGTSLLFLGFKLEEWDFRIFFRSLAGREGSGWKVQRKGLTHVAVQIDPEESRMLDAERARDYLRQYFGEAKIDIYWGSVADFLRELMERWEDWRKKHERAL